MENNFSLYQDFIGGLIQSPEQLINFPSKIDAGTDFGDDQKAKLVFTAVNNLVVVEGNKAISSDMIISYLLDRCKITTNEQKSYRSYLEAIYEKINGEDGSILKENLSANYTKLKKEAMLRELLRNGFAPKDYDLESKNQEKQLEAKNRFNSSPAEEILSSISGTLEKIKGKYTFNQTNKSIKIADGLQELLDSFKESPDIGPELCGEYYNSIVGGARRGMMYLRSANSNVGKAIPNYTKIPLFNGTWKRVDEIQVGDKLIGSNGKPVTVLKVHPQPEKKEIYEISFLDGHKVECCKEHLWTYYYYSPFGIKKQRTETTEQILERGIKDEKNFCRFHIPVVEAVDYSEKKFSISPYDIGKDLYENKITSIPNEYLYGSIAQRTDLLKGILGKKQETLLFTEDYFIQSPLLEKQIELLSRGLGFCPFKMQEEPEEPYLVLQRRSYIAITNICPTGTYTEMTCFTVDAPDALFCMDNYTLTHNTRFSAFDACNLAFPIKYSASAKNFVWYKDKEPQKVLFITTEMQPKEIQTMVLAYVSGVEEQYIKRGILNPEEEYRISQAMKIIEAFNDYFILTSIENPDLNNVENLIKQHILLDDVGYVFYDYIFTSPALLQQFSSSGLREDVVLMMLSTKLKDIAATYDVFVSTSTQLNGDGLKFGEKRDQRMLRGSKAIADKVDVASILSKVIPEDLEQIQPYIQEFGLPTHVLDIYKLRSGRYKNSRVWFRANLGTGERTDLFITDENNELIILNEAEIIPQEKGQSCEISEDFLKKVAEGALE